MPAVKTPTFELGYRRTPAGKARGLAEQPAGFRPFISPNYRAVANRATQLNDVQKGMFTPDYLFFADTRGPDVNPLHCDVCKAIAIHEASHDED